MEEKTRNFMFDALENVSWNGHQSVIGKVTWNYNLIVIFGNMTSKRIPLKTFKQDSFKLE